MQREFPEWQFGRGLSGRWFGWASGSTEDPPDIQCDDLAGLREQAGAVEWLLQALADMHTRAIGVEAMIAAGKAAWPVKARTVA